MSSSVVAKLQPCVVRWVVQWQRPSITLPVELYHRNVSWLEGMQIRDCFFFQFAPFVPRCRFCELQHGLFCPDAGSSIIFCDQAVHWTLLSWQQIVLWSSFRVISQSPCHMISLWCCACLYPKCPHIMPFPAGCNNKKLPCYEVLHLFFSHHQLYFLFHTPSIKYCVYFF